MVLFYNPLLYNNYMLYVHNYYYIFIQDSTYDTVYAILTNHSAQF